MYCDRATQRAICAHVSSLKRQTTRKVSGVRDDSTTYNRMELDSHADTIVLSRNCVIMQYTGRECDVSPYMDTYAAIKGVPIIMDATSRTSQQSTGETTILIFNEALWMGEVMEHSLLNRNQLRSYGIRVQDNPFDQVQMHLATEDGNLIIPMEADGTTIHFSTRTPTDQELRECPHVIMTSRAERNPRSVVFPEHTCECGDEPKPSRTISAIQREALVVQEDEIQLEPATMAAEIRVENPFEVADDVPLRRTFISKDRHPRVTPEDLSERWGIGLTNATNTIRVTTQKGTRSAILPLSRRYRADRVFERPLLREQFSTDTLDGRHKSLDGNRYAQVFATKDLFSAAYPMQSKSMAGEGLRQFIREYGRPEHLTFDGSQEQCGKKTEFMKNIRKYAIDHHVSERYRPNHNPVEGVIRELRKKWFRVMVKKSVPCRLWDDGLRWVSEIQNRTSNTARGLDGRCPLEKVTGESVDISEYLDFGF